jgi:hypothetical protein
MVMMIDGLETVGVGWESLASARHTRECIWDYLQLPWVVHNRGIVVFLMNCGATMPAK